MRDAYIVGAAMTQYGRWPDKATADLGKEAIDRLLHDTGFPAERIQAAYFGRSFGGWIDGQVSIPGQVALRGTGIENIQVLNFDNACAAGPSALGSAAHAVRSGLYDAVLVVGMDKLFADSRLTSMSALLGAMDVRENGWMLTEDPTRVGSLFMENYYAEVARKYIARANATLEDLAQIAVKNRHHASLNPFAHYRDPITIDDVLGSGMIADPLTKLMCSPLTDGAAAMLVCADSTKPSGSIPVRIAAAFNRSGYVDVGDRPPAITRVAELAYAEARLSPDDIDIAEVHDASAVAELIAIEQLGLAGTNGAVAMLRAGDSALGGRTPVNVSGGLLSRGHPGAGTGAAQLVEIVWQLQGRCGERQVKGAKHGISQSTGGLVGSEAACTAVTILSRD
jgi:acetyl-CoA acyltransferase